MSISETTRTQGPLTESEIASTAVSSTTAGLRSSQTTTVAASTATSDVSVLPSITPSTEGGKLPAKKEEDVGTANARRVYRAFDPYRWVMGPLLRFPFQQKITPEGRYQFVYKKKSYVAVGFVGISVFIAIITVIVLINTIGTLLDFPAITKDFGPDDKYAKGNLRFEEMYIMRRNIVPIIVIITSLFHGTVASWQIFRQRNFIASYLTFWTE